MKNTITCPSCGETFVITDALKKDLETEMLAGERERHEKEMEEVKKKASEQLLGELKLLKEDAIKKEKQLEEARAIELSLRKEKNKLDEERKTFELDKQRQLDSEREKIRQKTLEEAGEKTRLKEKEKDMIIDQLKKSLEDAQRKASQGSQQLQGEVQELDLEDIFHREFPQDLIEPIGKGVLGADIRQIVRSPLGAVCGTILWESKRTKQWSDSWTTKLKSDMLADKANIPAIISEVLPEEAKNGIGLRDGVWVASPKFAMPLAALLRKSLLDVGKQKKIAENKQTKAEELYSYVTSHDFQHQVEAMIEVYKDMQEQIQKERTSFERSWKLREQQVQRLFSGVAGMYGSMQGIAGAALPTIKNLELPSGDDDVI